MSIKRRAALLFCGAAFSLLAACGSGSSGGGAPVPPGVVAPTLVSIAVTPATASIDTAAIQQFVATGTYSDGSTGNLSSAVTWKVGSTPTAAITGSGVASGVDAGTSTVSAFAGSVVSNAALLEVKPTTWKPVASMNGARAAHKAVVLLSGEVLVAGGSTAALSAERYNPSTDKWTVTGQMINNRVHHGMFLLKTGKVLVFAGNNSVVVNGTDTDNYLLNTELYDPVNGTWTAAAPMNNGRRFHAATMLEDGKVLVSGGTNGADVNSTEIYDPVANTWAVVAPLNTQRSFHTATLLPGNKVLVTGGVNSNGRLASAEVYNPVAGTWMLATGTMAEPRQQHTATLVNGKVVVVGGRTTLGSNFWTANSEIFDPASGLFTAGDSMTDQRSVHTANLMPNGNLIVAGGENGSATGAPTQIAKSETFGSAGSTPVQKTMNEARVFHSTVLLPNGRLLATGGYGSAGAPATAELL